MLRGDINYQQGVLTSAGHAHSLTRRKDSLGRNCRDIIRSFPIPGPDPDPASDSCPSPCPGAGLCSSRVGGLLVKLATLRTASSCRDTPSDLFVFVLSLSSRPAWAVSPAAGALALVTRQRLTPDWSSPVAKSTDDKGWPRPWPWPWP